MKILALPTGLNGCSWIRIVSPFQVIEREGLAESKYFLPERFAEFHNSLGDWLNGADVIIFRGDHFELINKLLTDYSDIIDISKKVLVYDSDDNDYLIPPDNQAYRWWGTEDVWWNDRQNNKTEPLWIDEATEFGKALKEVAPGRCFPKDINIKRCIERDMAISSADLVTVTTQRLAEVYEPMAKKVMVIPNAIDFTKWFKKKKVNTNGKIRIGWSGGDSHYVDFLGIKDDLIKLLKSNKNITFVQVGSCNPELFEEVKDQYESYSWVSAEAHPYLVQCLDIDIALIPLAGRKFDDYKSAHKWNEFSSINIPCVCSNVAPYKDYIKNGVDGLLYNNSKEMVKKLKELINDPLKRITIGNNAHKRIYTEFNSSNVVKDYIEALKKIQEEK